MISFIALMVKSKDYKVSMEEIHHTSKADKPSGTAISLSKRHHQSY
jgi:4-hydroxy-tetrahydrodipicolinate reductase